VMMMYRVRIYCDDCYGDDPLGCFDGGTQLLCDAAPPYETFVFANLDAARKAGADRVRNCSPWRYEVIDEDDQVVASS